MESTVIAAIALLALGAGTIALLARQGLLPAGLPTWRSADAPGEPTAGTSRPRDRDGDPAPGITPRSSLVSSLEAVDAAPIARPPERRPLEAPDPIRLDLSAAREEAIASRLDRIEERLEALHEAVTRQTAEARLAAGQIAAELASRSDAANARQEAALERQRADLIATVARAGDRSPPQRDRRADVCAELYARTARLEAALAAVTNPVLLPGEAYAPPADFLPEALVWENWNEVGERAFALAEHFSAQRLYLSVDARDELAGFVTTLRTLLTRSIYPNLLPDPDRAQQEALRAALDEIAAALPRLRDLLEREHRGEDSG